MLTTFPRCNFWKGFRDILRQHFHAIHTAYVPPLRHGWQLSLHCRDRINLEGKAPDGINLALLAILISGA